MFRQEQSPDREDKQGAAKVCVGERKQMIIGWICSQEMFGLKIKLNDKTRSYGITRKRRKRPFKATTPFRRKSSRVYEITVGMLLPALGD